MKARSILKNAAGFSLVGTLVAASLVVVISAAVMQLISDFASARLYTEFSMSTLDLSYRIKNTLRDPRAWAKTLQVPANSGVFACLITGSGCTANSGGPFELVDIAGDPVILNHVSSPQNGFTHQGMPCNDFDENGGNPRCPLQVRMSWRTTCFGGAGCPQYKVTIVGDFVYAPGDRGVAFNPARYGFTMDLNSLATTLNCVTGTLNAQGAMAISSTTDPSITNFNDVFTADLYDAATSGDTWGVNCRPGWVATSCVGENLGMNTYTSYRQEYESTGTNASPVNIFTVTAPDISIIGNGCSTDDEEAEPTYNPASPWATPTIGVTCCQ